MKSIPYKCKFGHISIKSFQDMEEKPSKVECDTCVSEQVMKVRIFKPKDNHHLAKQYIWASNKTDNKTEVEMAVRI